MMITAPSPSPPLVIMAPLNLRWDIEGATGASLQEHRLWSCSQLIALAQACSGRRYGSRMRQTA
jgi:hypothetical protein